MAGVRQSGARIAAGLTWRQLVELEACARCGECRSWCPVYAQDARESLCAAASWRRCAGWCAGTLPEAGPRRLPGEPLRVLGLRPVPRRLPGPHRHPGTLGAGAAGAGAARACPARGPDASVGAIREFDNSYSRPQAERGRWAEHAFAAGLLKEPVRLWRERPAPYLYFAGCTASFDAPMQYVAVQSARLLQEAGVDFAILGPDEPCCASKLRRMGDESFPAEAARRIALLGGLGGATIVASCAGCFKGLHGDYARLPSGALPVVHLTQLLDRLIAEGRLRLRFEVPLRVTYHDPCHLGRHSQIYEEPRRVLRSIPGLQLVEMPRHGAFSSCCGMGGGLKLANEGLQHRMAAQRIREAEETGAQAIVTPCQTCCLGLINGVKETGSRIRVLHLNDVVAAAVCPEVSAEKVAAAFAAGC